MTITAVTPIEHVADALLALAETALERDRPFVSDDELHAEVDAVISEAFARRGDDLLMGRR